MLPIRVIFIWIRHFKWSRSGSGPKLILYQTPRKEERGKHEKGGGGGEGRRGGGGGEGAGTFSARMVNHWALIISCVWVKEYCQNVHSFPFTSWFFCCVLGKGKIGLQRQFLYSHTHTFCIWNAILEERNPKKNIHEENLNTYESIVTFLKQNLNRTSKGFNSELWDLYNIIRYRVIRSFYMVASAYQ
jgi:hypothetical protein